MASIIRIAPYEYIHVLNKNTNVTRLMCFNFCSDVDTFVLFMFVHLLIYFYLKLATFLHTLEV